MAAEQRARTAEDDVVVFFILPEFGHVHSLILRGGTFFSVSCWVFASHHFGTERRDICFSVACFLFSFFFLFQQTATPATHICFGEFLLCLPFVDMFCALFAIRCCCCLSPLRHFSALCSPVFARHFLLLLSSFGGRGGTLCRDDFRSILAES